MEAARPAFRADPVASAVIVVVAGYLLHEGFKGLQLTGCHVAHFVFSPFLAAPPSSARGRLFQLSGNKKRGFASCSELENETNPLSFSDIQMISRMVWMMPSSSPTIRASPPIRPPMMMLSAKIPTVPDMPYPKGTSQRHILRMPNGKPTQSHIRK